MNTLKAKGHLKNSERALKSIESATKYLENQKEYSEDKGELAEILEELVMLQDRMDDYVSDIAISIDDFIAGK